MNYVSAEQDNMDMMLTQMGAKVKSIHGLLCFVRFTVHDTELFYTYNINAKNQYYLQRVLPYPVGAGVFTNPSEIVDYIEKDVKSFKNAAKSSSFDSYIDIHKKLHATVHQLENDFINYNVPHDKMRAIDEALDKINMILKDIQQTSEKIVIE